MEINRNVLLPNLVTMGNGVCGFAALALLFKVSVTSGGGPLAFQDPAVFSNAAWLILLGMVFDVFDGKVARMSGGASALGAQLDSFCDLISFGLAPAVIMMRLSIGYGQTWQRVVMIFSLGYFLFAMLRLARFTAENEPDDTAHVAFKGLPSPGAAGCVASLVIFYCYISAFEAKELQWISTFVHPETLKDLVSYIPLLLPPLGLCLGFAMVSSRLRFEHMGSRLFSRKHSFEDYVYLLFAVILVALVPEVILPLAFVGYLVYTPARIAFRYFVPGTSPEERDDSRPS